MNFRGIGKQPASLVAQHSVVLPAAFPKLVDDLHVFLGDIITVIVPILLFETQSLGRTIQVSGHNVPCEPAIRQMIERRYPACECIGRLISQRARQAEAEMLCNRLLPAALPLVRSWAT